MPTSGYDLRDAPEIQVTHWYWEEGNEKLNNARYCELWLPIVKRSQNSTTGKTGVREKNIPALFAAGAGYVYFRIDFKSNSGKGMGLPGFGTWLESIFFHADHIVPPAEFAAAVVELFHLGIAQGGMKFNAVPGHIGVRPGGGR